MNVLVKIAGIGLLAAFTSHPLSVAAQELPSGVTYQVVQEFPASAAPGAKLVQETLFVMQPGTQLVDFKNETLAFCIVLAGELKATKGDKTVTLKAGDTYILQPGEVYTLVNEGKVAFVDRAFEITYE